MKLFRRSSRSDESRPNSPEQRFFRLTVWAFVAMFVLFGLAGTTAFLLALRGPEQTQVPDTRGEELAQAVVELQERGLYPQVQLRFDSDPTLKGRVISQDPEPGAVVRAGRRITLLVSQGAVVDAVGDYVGEQLLQVQSELQTLGVGGESVLFVDAVSYVFDEAPSGTIVGQAPEPGTEITGSTGLDLVVSRGPEVERIALPTFVGLDWSDALQVLSRDDVPFVFQLEEQPTVGQEGVVVAQDPDPGQEVVLGTPVVLTIRDLRSVPEGEQFDVFDRTLPEYAVAVELSAVVVGPEGESSTLFNMLHPGGRIAFPYQVETGSTIVIYRYDTEVIRVVVRDTEDSDG